MAKESLFNILANTIDFEGLKVLDLFSGTGSISYEFVSRGSAHVTLVENDFYHFRFILKTIESLKFSDRIIPVKGDVFRFIAGCKEKFSLIFADPPYNLKNIKEVPGIIMEKDMLRENGIMVMEHPGNCNFTDVKGYIRTRKYGSVNFSFFERK